MQDKTLNLKSLLIDIINGYSFFENKNLKFHIKHIDNFDVADADYIADKYRKEAISKKIPTLEEREQAIIKEGYWSNEKNTKIKDDKTFLNGMKLSKGKLFRQAEIDQINQEIEKTEKDILRLEYEKSELIGQYTVEKYVNKAVTNYFILHTLYKDKKLQKKYFNEEEFENLSDPELADYVAFYNEITGRFEGKNIKKIAVMPNFLNSFGLCADNPMVYYGKPVCQLTFLQMELFHNGRYFKHVLSEYGSKIPDHLYEDPDKLVDYVTSAKNIQELADKAPQEGNVGIVGSKSDLDKISGEYSPRANLRNEAIKRGGSLNFEEVIALENR